MKASTKYQGLFIATLFINITVSAMAATWTYRSLANTSEYGNQPATILEEKEINPVSTIIIAEQVPKSIQIDNAFRIKTSEYEQPTFHDSNHSEWVLLFPTEGNNPLLPEDRLIF